MANRQEFFTNINARILNTTSTTLARQIIPPSDYAIFCLRYDCIKIIIKFLSASNGSQKLINNHEFGIY